MKLMRYALGCVLMASFGVANAGMLFDRGLPTANLNNAAGGNRSNVAWATTNPSSGVTWLMGDDFTIAGDGNYDVDTVRVWIVDSKSTPYSGAQMSLWGGTTGGSMSLLSTNYNYSQVTYEGGAIYQGSSTSMITIWQVDFDVDWYVKGDELQSFYIGGNATGLTPSIHASNAALSGSTQEGADDLYRWAYTDGVTMVEYPDLSTSLGYGWDKASDFNVQVLGTKSVPGPAAVLPFLIGGIVALRRRRK
jgi:hypothetical protein